MLGLGHRFAQRLGRWELGACAGSVRRRRQVYFSCVLISPLDDIYMVVHGYALAKVDRAFGFLLESKTVGIQLVNIYAVVRS